MMKIATLLIMTLIISATAHPAVWYVDRDNVSGNEDGTSWETAFTSIQPAIDAAFDDGGAEVWVAAGVYDEERTSMMYSPSVNTGALVMGEGVHLYGGFAGAETARELRDWRAHVTVIDGSNSRSGMPAYHVVYGADDATLNGFTITGGNANGWPSPRIGSGGGMLIRQCSPMVEHCIFVDNRARTNNSTGGALAIRESEAQISYCEFVNNSATHGGAIHMGGSAYGVSIKHCSFIANRAIGGGSGGAIRGPAHVEHSTFTGNSAGSGGALYSSTGVIRVTDCVFSNNVADRSPPFRSSGGAISTYIGSVTAKSCVFEGNSADDGGAVGALHDLMGAPGYWARFENCVFVNNSARERGGAIYVVGEATWTYDYTLYVEVTNCSFGGNEAGESGSGLWKRVAILRVRNSVLWDEGEDEIDVDSARFMYSAVRGGYWGEGNIDTDPRFRDVAGGDLSLQFGSPCIDTGTAEDAPETDIQGRTRPIGDGIDMGAYESFDADVNDTGSVDATDVQLVINAVLGLDVSPYSTDINLDGRTDAVDLQLVINAVLEV